jgi:hypothetical protein
MNSYETGSAPVLFQALVGLVLALAFGPWLTISGLRVMLRSSHVRKRSFVNWMIRRYSTSGPLARGNIYAWAWMVFLTGVGFDLLGVLMLVAIVGIYLRW